MVRVKGLQPGKEEDIVGQVSWREIRETRRGLYQKSLSSDRIVPTGGEAHTYAWVCCGREVWEGREEVWTPQTDL